MRYDRARTSLDRRRYLHQLQPSCSSACQPGGREVAALLRGSHHAAPSPSPPARRRCTRVSRPAVYPLAERLSDRSGLRYQAIRSAPGRLMFGASPASRSVTFFSFPTSLSSETDSHCRRSPSLYQIARHQPPFVRAGQTVIPCASSMTGGQGPSRASRSRSGRLPAAAGSTHRPDNPPGHRSRLTRLPRRGLAGPARCSLPLEGVRVYFAGPSAKATAGNLNRRREPRAPGQLVGSGPAELEQRADVTDADQPVRARPPSQDALRFGGRRGLRVWQRHGPDGRRGKEATNNTVICAGAITRKRQGTNAVLPRQAPRFPRCGNCRGDRGTACQ